MSLVFPRGGLSGPLIIQLYMASPDSVTYSLLVLRQPLGRRTRGGGGGGTDFTQHLIVPSSSKNPMLLVRIFNPFLLLP